MTLKIEEILAQYLSEIESGESTLEEVLAKQPALQEELEPLLRLALSLAPSFSLAPAHSFQRSARAELLQRIASLGVTRGGLSRYFDWIGLTGGQKPKMMPAIVALLVVFLVATGGGVAYAAQDSLPGDGLYPVKIALEQVQVALATSDEAKAQAFMHRAERRLEELTLVAGLGKGDRGRELAQRYEENIVQVLASLEQSGEKGKDVVELLERLQENLDRQQSVLGRVQGQVSEQAWEAIAHAMEVSRRGKERASEAAERWQAGQGEALPSSPGTPTAPGRGRQPNGR